MTKGLDYAKNQVKEFHKAFGHPVSDKPTPIPPDIALSRTKWSVEEDIEFLYATANNDKNLFDDMFIKLITSMVQTRRKILDSKKVVKDVLVEQIDALCDKEYFNMGNFVIAGVDPQAPFNKVQEANMNKLWPDGKPRYDENNGGKIIKPEGWVGPEVGIKEEVNKQRKK